MNTPVSIKAVESRSDLGRFIAFPYRLYANSPYWIPPLRVEQRMTLNPKSNPFCRHGTIQPFIAVDDKGEVAGRIAAVVNTLHLEKYKDGLGFFGFFECVERPEIAEALIQAAAQWLKAQGLIGMRGPASPSMNHICGLLVKGFEHEPGVFMPYNPPYYESFLLRSGFERSMTMYSYYLHKRYVDFGKVRPLLEEIREHYPNLQARPAEPKRFDEEAAVLLEIYNKSLEANWGHVPMTDAEFCYLVKFFRHLVEPKLVCFLEDLEKKIGFILAVPNFNEVLRHLPDGRLWPLGWWQFLLRWKFGGIRSVRAAMGGVLPEYRGHGLALIMGLLAAENNWLGAYEGVEFSWILQTNKLFIDTLEHVGAVREKEYAMFEKRLV